MEIQEATDGASISIAFPLGLALLVLLLLGMSCLFCCCLHWDRLRSLLISSPDVSNTELTLPIRITDTGSPHKPVPQLLIKKQDPVQSLPVLMPGDEFPKFVALPCPCQPPIMEKHERFLMSRNWDASRHN